MITPLKNVGKLPNTLYSSEILSVSRGSNSTQGQMDICPETWGQEGWGAEDGLNYTHFSQGQIRADVALVPGKGRPS